MGPSRSKGILFHAMLIVGYDSNANTSVKYWIVMNSWGPTRFEGEDFRKIA